MGDVYQQKEGRCCNTFSSKRGDTVIEGRYCNGRKKGDTVTETVERRAIL